MAEESSLAMAELSVGVQTTLSRTDVRIRSFKFDFDKAVKELDEKIAVLFDLELDIRTLPSRKNSLFRLHKTSKQVIGTSQDRNWKIIEISMIHVRTLLQ